VVRVEGAGLGADEGLAEGLEAPGRAVPDEAVRKRRCRRAQPGLETTPHERVGAVCRHHEVEVLELPLVRHGVSMLQGDPGHLQALDEPLQQDEAPDRRKADIVDGDALSTVGDRQVGPPLHGRREQIVGLRIVVAQELERAV